MPSYLSDLFGGMTGEAQANEIQTNGEALTYIDTSTFSGVAVTFNQIVNLESTFSGPVATFNQIVTSSFSGAAVTFKQRIVTGESTFYQKHGYDLKVYIGNLIWDTATLAKENGFCDTLTIKAVEGQSRQCSFTVIPPEGVQSPEDYISQPVQVVAKTSTGIWVLFTGFVDVPSLDIKARKMTLTCSDRRSTLITDLDPGVIQNIGSFSADIFGVPKDQTEELDRRLETIPASFDFTNNGQPALTPWLPKAVADFTLGNEVYWREPKVQYTNRLKTVNTVNLTVTYSYVRLHQQSVSATWAGYDDFCHDWINAGNPSFPYKQAVLSAAISGSWTALDNPQVTFVDLWPASTYSCGPTIWQPNSVVRTYKTRTQFRGYLRDSLGGFVTVKNQLQPIYEDVLDSHGNPIQDVVKEVITDTSSMLCRGASWNAIKRFSQNVTETRNITIQAPQAIAENNNSPVIQKQSASLNDPYNADSWSTVKQGTTNNTTNFFIDQKALLGQFKNTYLTAVDIAKCTILKAHRDVIVSFSLPLWGEIDLSHTVHIDCTIQVPTWTQAINAKGKVGSFTHTIDFSHTKLGVTSVELWLSRAQGTATTDPVLFAPVQQDVSYIGTPKQLNLQTHVGQNPDPAVNPDAINWNGYIGNANTTVNSFTTRTNYAESFIVDYPAIPEALTAALPYNQDLTFDLEIPNDDLEESF